MLAISAGVGALHLYERERHRRLLRGAFAILLIWQFFGALRAHPDYMPYFNELAGGRPERVVVDSDLDWGQDLLRLADTVRQRQLERVSVAYYGSAVPAQHLASAYRALRPAERADGCIAISERLLAGIVFGEANDGYAWLRKYNDYERIGKSIRLLGIPSDACRPPPIRR
jgi:hypothetical protein